MEKIGFKQLSFWLKIPIVIIWLHIILILAAFSIGFLSVFLGY